MKRIKLWYLALPLLMVSCQTQPANDGLFRLMSPKETGIDFVNTVENTKKFNIFSYRNFYNGGGVALGDINQDGLIDVYLTNNMGKNKLYLNQGDFKFEDITERAGVGGSKGWSTGVVMVDINNDGLLDIYVCNAGYVEGDDQENELFLNNGDGTFKEDAAAYGLDESGYTTHAAFLDYDLDGDLDVYILNNSFIPVSTLNYNNRRDLRAPDWPVRDFLKGGGDKLLRNDNGQYVDVSEEAGIYGSLIGFGLGITVGDVNGDHYPDMYVSNDFYERDYLYINQQDGTFSEEIKDWMSHISLSSMGADMADINNDGNPEIFVTEMLPDNDYRLKTMTMFESYNVYRLKQQRDFYHQYMQNTLQLNNGDETFSEIAYYSGVAASDWSWGALMFDADNDGYRDLYVCNGIYQDVTNQDFIDFFANDIVQKMVTSGEKEELENVVAKMPSDPQPNKAFRNTGNLKFEDIGEDWGFNQASFSNGAAYGDLDNDGDLDLIVNNLNEPSFIFQNRSNERSAHHFLQVELKGSEQNTHAIGAKVMAYAGSEIFNFQMIPTRGFQSSIDYKMTFGLGEIDQIDSLVVIWPDRSSSLIANPGIDQVVKVDYANRDAQLRTGTGNNRFASNALIEEVPNDFAPHKEDSYIDFFQEGLTMRMVSREGPKAAVGDVNGDGTEDVFIGAASGQIAHLYLQKNGQFQKDNSGQFEGENYFEDTFAEFFDFDGDGDLDLFVGSGGNNRPATDRFNQDRIYLNDGAGNFILGERILPKNGYNTSFALPIDFDEDGNMDLIVGSRSVPMQYGANPQSYVYKNDGRGRYLDVTSKVAPEFLGLGMLTDAKLADMDGDGRSELIVVGEWMAPQVFDINENGFQLRETALTNMSGWWYAVETADLDNDGDQDLIMGNLGDNFYFTGSPEAPTKLWVSDFDDNRTVDKIMTRSIDGKDKPIPMKKELTEQIVSLKKQNLKHSEYANKSIQDLFTKEVLEEALVKEATYFKSVIAINDGKGNFTIQELPAEVQFSCVCDIYCTDLNGDQQVDIILGGNDSGFTPQYSKLDASFGHVLINQGDGQLQKMPNREAGLYLRGDVKQLIGINMQGEKVVLANLNGQQAKLLKINQPNPN